jgi:LCP family protein required for cell wall assembly
MQEDNKTENTDDNEIISAINADINPNEIKSENLEEDILDSVVITQEYDIEDEDISDSLRQQVQEELVNQQNDQLLVEKKLKKKKIWKRVLITTGSVLAVLLIVIIWLVGTQSGRSLIYKMAGNYIYSKVDKADDMPVSSVTTPDNTNVIGNDVQTAPEDITEPNSAMPREESYVTNFLIFGIEEIEGASNTDSMMIASINTKDKSVKLTSLMRDTYMDIPGESPKKLNAVYAEGGADKLVRVIEQSYHIKIDGYAHIDFESFENIIDRLGGISIELGEKEANYLNTTNYISDPANRNVQAGWNVLNGNQALGYCRIRKVETLGGVHDDYGRTLRQRRVLSAIFDKYKSKSFLDLLSIMNDCLGDVTTNITASQFENSLEAVVENRITTMDTLRIPEDGAFEYYHDYHGVNDPLVIDWDKNLTDMFKFIFLDTDTQVEQELAVYQN